MVLWCFHLSTWSDRLINSILHILSIRCFQWQRINNLIFVVLFKHVFSIQTLTFSTRHVLLQWKRPAPYLAGVSVLQRRHTLDLSCVCSSSPHWGPSWSGPDAAEQASTTMLDRDSVIICSILSVRCGAACSFQTVQSFCVISSQKLLPIPVWSVDELARNSSALF